MTSRLLLGPSASSGKPACVGSGAFTGVPGHLQSARNRRTQTAGAVLAADLEFGVALPPTEN